MGWYLFLLVTLLIQEDESNIIVDVVSVSQAITNLVVLVAVSVVLLEAVNVNLVQSSTMRTSGRSQFLFVQTVPTSSFPVAMITKFYLLSADPTV